MKSTSLKDILKQSNGHYLEIYKVDKFNNTYEIVTVSQTEQDKLVKKHKNIKYKRYNINLASLDRNQYRIKIPVDTFIHNDTLVRVYDIETLPVDTAPYIDKYDMEVDVTEIDLNGCKLVLESGFKYVVVENDNLALQDLEQIVSNLN